MEVRVSDAVAVEPDDTVEVVVAELDDVDVTLDDAVVVDVREEDLLEDAVAEAVAEAEVVAVAVAVGVPVAVVGSAWGACAAVSTGHANSGATHTTLPVKPWDGDSSWPVVDAEHVTVAPDSVEMLYTAEAPLQTSPQKHTGCTATAG